MTPILLRRLLPPVLAFTMGCTGTVGSSSSRTEDMPSDDDAPTTDGNERGGSGGQGEQVPPQQSVCKLPARRLVKLTPEQYDRTVRPYVYTGGARFSEAWRSTVGSFSGFYSNHADRLDMPALHVWRIFEESGEIARRAVDDGSLYHFGLYNYKDNQRYRCSAEPDEACVTKYLRDWAARLYRRPLEPAELDRYAGFFRTQALLHGGRRAFEMVAEAVLMSPHVLYRTELGVAGEDGTYELTPFEKAEALSYLIMDGPPDEELYALAETGDLTRDELANEAERLIAKRPKLKSNYPEWGAADGAIGLDKFFREYFQFQNIRFAPKGWRFGVAFNPKKEHGWEVAVANGAAETQHFLHDWFWEAGATPKTLLDADYTFVNSELAAYYDITLASPVGKDEPFVKAKLPPYRKGLLTQVSFLGTYGKEWTPDIVHRGLYIREKLLCGEVSPPPPDVPSAAQLENAAGKTYNELIAEHSSNPRCAGCHSYMDPLGRPFQTFDSAGIHRSVDTDQAFAQADPKLERPLGAIDGEITETLDTNGRVADAEELIRKLAESKDVTRCLGANFYRYAQARKEADTDACSMQQLYESALANGGNMRELLINIVKADDFVLRSKE